MTWQPEIDELSGVGEHETVEGGVSAGHKSTLETAEDQESKRAALENYSTNSLAALSPRPRRSTSPT